MNRISSCLLLILLGLISLCLTPTVSADGGVVINEALVHPSGDNKEWVELYTAGSDLTNYWIDDDTDFTSDTGGSSKKQMTTVVQGADSYHVVFELPSAMFNNDEDTIALFSPQGQLIDSYHYTSDPGENVTIGRTPDATGTFSVLDHGTRGSANSSAKPTATPTPEPTDKPTKEPTATKTPSPTELNDPTITETISKSIVGAVVKQPASLKARPTSILGIATKAAEKRQAEPQPTVMVKGAATNPMPMALISFGGLFFLSCGILIYLKKTEIWG